MKIIRYINSKKSKGFTIVELLVVAPIVLLTISILIGVIINVTSDTIATRSQNLLTYSVQDSLNRIEQDVYRTTNFFSVNSISISSPQGYNNDTTVFKNVGTNGVMLILSLPATNKNPLTNDYRPIYLSNSPYICASSDVSKNNKMMINIVYFVKDSTLWRRTLMPSNYASAGCETPYQKPSCAQGQTGAMCMAEDVKVADSINTGGLLLDYYIGGASTNALTTAVDSSISDTLRGDDLKTARNVKATLNLTRTVAGRTLNRSDNIRVDRQPTVNTTFKVSSLVTCPAGFIVVPGSTTYGTSDFCVMKYEAKQVGSTTTPISTASGTPWVSINQTTASTNAANLAGCTGCKLITEAEWLTIAQNVLSNPINWSGNAVGSGYIYSGHNDNSPGNSLAASDDTNGYFGTGNTSGNQKRTLTLTNGETIWDMAGNVWEWTAGQKTGGQPTGTPLNWREWTAVSGGTISPSPFPSTTAIYGSGSWTSANGIGMIFSDSADTTLRGFIRGGEWNIGLVAGVLSLHLSVSPTTAGNNLGFRVTK